MLDELLTPEELESLRAKAKEGYAVCKQSAEAQVLSTYGRGEIVEEDDRGVREGHAEESSRENTETEESINSKRSSSKEGEINEKKE